MPHNSKINFSLAFAAFLNTMTCGLWRISPPEITNQVAKGVKPADKPIEDVKIGYHFFSEMINRMVFKSFGVICGDFWVKMIKTYKRMSFLVINMLLVIAFCSTWLLSFITHSNHVHSNDDIDNDKGQGCPC